MYFLNLTFSYTPSVDRTYYYLSKIEKKLKGRCSKFSVIFVLELPPLTKKQQHQQKQQKKKKKKSHILSPSYFFQSLFLWA